ncbi:hypothetical protein MCS44_07555 [Staphylococcus aureus]|uniref:hypothetical protein n=1 Tax=Staphylococcus aureus TaxID=1280 RepID=UPI000931A3AA|nr:hypothetical protein [Staphylococcus aureus]MCG5184216.1 hypothetical protein [Staphylococcus aureus]WIZ13624.1 hypothetical protein PCL58_07715 [Staphylococcus aureus]HCU1024318.1 hypothetical protein [Staphylococcus aureus]HCU9903384.1 hypothetical protein [Staphylococcus aureus]HCV7267374.1 hypothetical protein [Staphylococcus aureus]
MNKKSEGLDIIIPRIFRRDHASVKSLTGKERNLGAEILELIKKSDYSYLEINKVFYALDRELQYRANNNKL